VPGQSQDAAGVVLAAGRGTRMKSGRPKVLHRAGGRPLVAHVLDALAPLKLRRSVVVTAAGRVVEDDLRAGGWAAGVDFAVQDPPAGTADAVRVALDFLGGHRGPVLVAQGATPLVTTATLGSMLSLHATRGAPATVLTAVRPDPFGYGRVVRDAHGEITAIVEERDASDDQRLITEVNAGVYVFDAAALGEVLVGLGRDNDQGEYYLPDVIAALRSRGEPVATHSTRPEEVFGVKSRLHLAEVEAVLRRRVCERWMADGVTIVDPDTTYIDSGATLEADAIVRPFSFIEGRTVIRAGADVGPHVRIVDSDVGSGASVTYSVVLGSSVGDEAQVGPFASLRPGTTLERAAKLGTFVETKQSAIGEGSKVPHLAYVGDATIGMGVNVGAGAITANWDGRAKHPTVIEDEAYISSNTVLVAPTRIGRRAATGAGAVVRGEVPDDALAVGVPARVIPGKGNRRQPAAQEGPNGGDARADDDIGDGRHGIR
jgi:bifunctional UDP-N-acetylglucosamine pyrophosphorylase / glucosamine-1-phosphate N-acetyltransferase